MSANEQSITPQQLTNGVDHSGSEEGQVKLPLHGALEGHSVTIDGEKITLAWAERMTGGQAKEAISEIIVNCDAGFKGTPYPTGPEDLRTVWPMHKFKALQTAIAEYVRGPKDETLNN